MRAIHFFACKGAMEALKKASLTVETTWGGTLEAITETAREDNERDDVANWYVVRTTQMGLLIYAAQWLTDGWSIVIHDRTGVYAINLGDRNERTKRYISPTANLFTLWLAGEFDRKVRRCV